MATLSTSASPPGPQSALRDLLFRIRNVELESACVNLGLRKTGRKADLVGRIVEAVSQDQQLELRLKKFLTELMHPHMHRAPSQPAPGTSQQVTHTTDPRVPTTAGLPQTRAPAPLGTAVGVINSGALQSASSGPSTAVQSMAAKSSLPTYGSTATLAAVHTTPANGSGDWNSQKPALMPSLPSDRPEVAFKVCHRSSATHESDPRTCFCGKTPAPTDVGTFTCHSVGCSAVYHSSCLGVVSHPLMPAQWESWRCPLCRIGAMMPQQEVACLLGKPFLLPTHHIMSSNSISWTFTTPFTKIKEKDFVVRLLSVRADTVRNECDWSPTLRAIAVNSVNISVPLATGGGAGPILDITNQCMDGDNTVAFRYSSAPSSHKRLMCAVLARTLTIDQQIQLILSRRMPPLAFSVDCSAATLQLACRPGGQYKGIARATQTSLYRVARSSRLHLAASVLKTTAPDMEISALPLPLRDVLSMLPLSIPVRGDTCKHIACLDLKQYLEMNCKPSGKWKCPYCKNTVMPMHLWVDTMMLHVMKTLATSDKRSGEFSLVEKDGLYIYPRHWAAYGIPAPTSQTVYALPVLNADGTFGSDNIPLKGFAVPADVASAGLSLCLSKDGTSLEWRCTLPTAAGNTDGVDDDDDDLDMPIPRRSNIPLAIDLVREPSPVRGPCVEVIEIIDSDSESRVAGHKRARSEISNTNAPILL